MKTRNRKRLVFFWIACQVIAFSLLFSPTLTGRAQQPQTITGTGSSGVMPLTMTFPPAGGPVTGGGVWHQHIVENEICDMTTNLTFSGTFAGGDGGAASGTLIWHVERDDMERCDQGNLPWESNGT